MPTYTGRQIFMETLLTHGVKYIFGNPGTTEMPIMDSLLDYPDLGYILTLHESVALGIAHYYAQASRETAVVNLHVAPGLGNALGMLYNAWEAGTPMLVTAGQQDSRMRLREPLLGHDLVAMAEPLVKWSVEPRSADELALTLRRAFKTASAPPPGPVFVSLPIDVMEQETENPPAVPSGLFQRSVPNSEGIAAAATVLLGARRPAIIAGDGVSWARAETELQLLAEQLGAAVYFEGLHHHLVFPTSHPNCRQRIAFEHGAIRGLLEGVDAVLLVGGSFFEEVWYEPGSPFPEGAVVLQIDDSPTRLGRNFPLEVGILGDIGMALAALRAAVEENADERFRSAAQARNGRLGEEWRAARAGQERRAESRWDQRPISAPRLMAEIRAAMPEETVLVDEAITAGPDLMRTFEFRQAGDYYGTRGGGIGQAVPGAVGAKLAHPGRPVLALSGDGSALYTIQSLWTAAHHLIPVVWVILHNREYRILKYNMDAYQRRFGLPGDRPHPHMDLIEPDPDFVALARGFGVEGERVDAPEDIAPALERAFAGGRPYLLDVWIEGGV